MLVGKGAVVLKLRASSCNGKLGIPKDESVKAKAWKRGQWASLSASIAFWVPLLPPEAEKRLCQCLKYCPRQSGFVVPMWSDCFALEWQSRTSWCLVFLEGKGRREVKGANCAVNKSLHPIAASSSYSTQIFFHFWLEKFSYRRNSSQSARLLGRANIQRAAQCLARTISTSWWAAQAAELLLHQELEFIRSLGMLLPALSPPGDELLMWPP